MSNDHFGIAPVKYSIGRKVIYVTPNVGNTAVNPRWGTVESYEWSDQDGSYMYLVACGDGTVKRFRESQLNTFAALR